MLKKYIGTLSTKSRILYLVCFLAAALFVILLPGHHPYRFSSVLKIIPMLSLLILVSDKINGWKRVLTILALIFCMIGDVLLDLDRSGNFKMALIAFLIGHLFYIVIFQMERHFKKENRIFLILIFIYTLIVGFLLKDISPEFLLPVMIYLLIISMMTLSSFLMRHFSWIISAGAIIFMFSDTVIAINKFLMPIPNSIVFNIGLYFIAQILIITGLIINEQNYG